MKELTWDRTLSVDVPEIALVSLPVGPKSAAMSRQAAGAGSAQVAAPRRLSTPIRCCPDPSSRPGTGSVGAEKEGASGCNPRGWDPRRLGARRSGCRSTGLMPSPSHPCRSQLNP
jgi:hypothetical protein